MYYTNIPSTNTKNPKCATEMSGDTMSTNWNQEKYNYTGQTLSWDQKDDIQRLLTMLQNDAVDTLNTVLEYRFVMDFTFEEQSYTNKAPYFWGEVMKSLRFTLIMKSARLFDESTDAIGIKKVFNILEQSPYHSIMHDDIKNAIFQYETYHIYIDEIRTIRDKLYAHNDRKEYQFWKHPSDKDIEFDGKFWGKLEEILIWVRDTLLSLRSLTGDSYPVNIDISNDLYNLLPNNND